MKFNIIKAVIALSLIGSFAIPAIVSAETQGQNTGGATAASSIGSAQGQSTGGATAASTVGSAQGQGVGGATAASTAISAVQGQGVGGATSASTIGSASGQGVGGATSASTIGSASGQGVGGATQSSSIGTAQGQNTGGATGSIGTANGQGVGGATGSIGTAQGQNTGGATVVSPVTPSNGSGSTGSSGSYSGVGSVSSFSSGGGYVNGLPVLNNIGQCKYINSYMKMGQNNPVSEVLKLQLFLKNTEGLDVDQTGIFDQKTLTAVNAFQAKYVQDVLIPWGVKTPTGFVYYTTSKKINEIYCQKNFSLTPKQIAEITAYRTALQNKKNLPSVEVGTKAKPSTTVKSNVTSPTVTPSINPTPSQAPVASSVVSPTGNDSQTASVTKTPVIQKVWNFIKRVFGR